MSEEDAQTALVIGQEIADGLTDIANQLAGENFPVIQESAELIADAIKQGLIEVANSIRELKNERQNKP